MFSYIQTTLIDLGLSLTSKGTYYLRDIILLAIQENNFENINLIELRNKLAKTKNTTPATIKSNIDYTFGFKDTSKAENRFETIFNIKYDEYRTLTTDENGAVIMGDTTKTYSGKRIVPIPDFLYPYILEQMKIADKQPNNDEKLLFKPYNSRYAKRRNVNSELKRILEKQLNITDISTHSLRHSYGTRCNERE